MQEQYNTRQLLSLGAVIALTPALRLFPTQAASIAGRAGWLAPLAALPLALVWARAMALLTGTMQPGEQLPDLLLRLGGKRLGKPALALFAAWCLTYAAFVLRSGADRLVGTVYPGASPALFSQLMGLTALLAALSTPRSLARIGRMLLPLLFGVLGLLLFFALLSVDFHNLFPLSPSDLWPVAKTAPVPLDIVAGSGTALCFLAGGLKERGPGFPALAKWSALLCAGLSLLSAAVIGAFGAPLTAQLARPFFVLVRTLVFFRTVERGARGGPGGDAVDLPGLSDGGAVFLGRAVRSASALRLSPGYENARPPRFYRGARADLGLWGCGDHSLALPCTRAAPARTLVHRLYPLRKSGLCVWVSSTIIYCRKKDTEKIKAARPGGSAQNNLIL